MGVSFRSIETFFHAQDRPSAKSMIHQPLLKLDARIGLGEAGWWDGDTTACEEVGKESEGSVTAAWLQPLGGAKQAVSIPTLYVCSSAGVLSNSDF